jgi:hypothetical protein
VVWYCLLSSITWELKRKKGNTMRALAATLLIAFVFGLSGCAAKDDGAAAGDAATDAAPADDGGAAE